MKNKLKRKKIDVMYREKYQDLHEISGRLERLIRHGDTASQIRLYELKARYQDQIHKLEKEVLGLKSQIEAELVRIDTQQNELNRQIVTNNKIIQEEKNLYSAGVINKEEFKTKVAPLDQQNKKAYTNLIKSKKQWHVLYESLHAPLNKGGYTQLTKNKTQEISYENGFESGELAKGTMTGIGFAVGCLLVACFALFVLYVMGRMWLSSL